MVALICIPIGLCTLAVCGLFPSMFPSMCSSGALLGVCRSLAFRHLEFWNRRMNGRCGTRRARIIPGSIAPKGSSALGVDARKGFPF